MRRTAGSSATWSLVLALCGAPVCGSAADAAVQRLLQQRDQQQSELQLKREQQQDRAVNPAPGFSSEMQRQYRDRSQLQRQQQLIDEQNRTDTAARAAVAAGSTASRQPLEDQAARARLDQLQRFNAERRFSNAEPKRQIEGDPIR